MVNPSSEDTLAPEPNLLGTDATIIASASATEPAGSDATVAAPERATTPTAARVTQHPLAPRIGRFSILRKLGEGGMGVVYAGYDEELDRKIAIKLLRGKAAGEGRKHRLIREAQGLARLSHPNVVQVYEIGEQGEDAFIAMEYVDGQTLGDWLDAQPRSRAEILAVFDAAGRGLAAAHDKGLVHRDFKPDNVMITRDGRVLVMDFGLVHEASNEAEAKARVVKMQESNEASIELSLRISALSTDLTATGALMGTPAYMSPEQFIGHGTDARTDQFSFCVALWEALCGERPFAGDDFATLCFSVTQSQRREPPRGKLSRHLRATLERGLSGKVEDRWPNMNALLAELRKNPARRRTVVAFAAAPLVLALGGWQLWRLEQEVAREQAIAACEAEAAEIGEDWNDDARSQIAADFHATGLPYADDSWARTAAVLDTYASEWTQLRGQACRSARVEGGEGEGEGEAEYLDIAACLDERRASLRSFVETLREVDDELVKSAIQTAANLPLLDVCVDATALALRVRPPDEQREQITALREQLQALGPLLATRPQQAIDRAGPLLDQALALGWAPLEAEARAVLGTAAYRLTKLDEAQPALEQAFWLAGEHGHDRLALDTALTLTQLELKREDYAMAMHWASLAGMFIARLELGDASEAAELETARGNAFNDQGQYEPAQQAHTRARDIWTALYGPDHHSVAIAWANLGISQRRQGHYTEALASMQESLRIRELTIGPTHPRIAESIYNMGNVLRQQGKQDEALALFQRALDIWTAALGPRNRNVAFALNNIGSFYFSRNEFDRALDYYTQARDIWIEALGPNHGDVALALNNIGNVYYYRKQYGDAVASYEQALQVTEAAKGPTHPDVAMTSGNLALARRDLGELDEALAASERAMAIQEQSYGLDHPEVAHGLQGRATIHAARGDETAARRDFERGLAIYEQREAAPMDRAELEYEFAKFEWKAGNRARALELAAASRQRCESAGATDFLADIDAWLRDKQ